MIKVPEVRLVGENITPGIYPTPEALKMAQDEGLDLVEISPGANPPVCKIIDYNKFIYSEKKKKKEMKAKAKPREVKEIRLRPIPMTTILNLNVNMPKSFCRMAIK